MFNQELIFKDIESIEKRMHAVRKLKGQVMKKGIKEYELLSKILKKLNEGIPVIEMELTDEENILIYDLFLLTNKRDCLFLTTKRIIEREKG